MPPLSSSIPWAHKHTGASSVGDVHSDALYLLLPQLTHPLSLLRPQDYLPLPTPLPWSPIPKALHHSAAASIVVTESLISPTHCLFLVLRQYLHQIVNSVDQAVKDYLTLDFWLRIYSGDGLYLWLLGAVFYLTLLETALLKIFEVQTEYLGYFTRNIQSFG